MAIMKTPDRSTHRHRGIKKTRQGCGRGTKFSHKGSKKRYIKKYRGQGGRKR